MLAIPVLYVKSITVDDVDALYAELQPKAVNITMPPTSQDWSNREMYVRDPDGNRLAFVCPLPPGG